MEAHPIYLFHIRKNLLALRKFSKITDQYEIFDRTIQRRQALDLLTTDNAQGEYYLPDTLTIIKDKGLKADAFALENAEDITGVNDQQQLAEAAEIIEKRKQTHS